MCNFVNVTCNASSNSQIGMMENLVIWDLKTYQNGSKLKMVSLRIFQRLCKSLITFNPVVIEYHKVLDKPTMVS